MKRVRVEWPSSYKSKQLKQNDLFVKCSNYTYMQNDDPTCFIASAFMILFNTVILFQIEEKAKINPNAKQILYVFDKLSKSRTLRDGTGESATCPAIPKDIMKLYKQKSGYTNLHGGDPVLLVESVLEGCGICYKSSTGRSKLLDTKSCIISSVKNKKISNPMKFFTDQKRSNLQSGYEIIGVLWQNDTHVSCVLPCNDDDWRVFDSGFRNSIDLLDIHHNEYYRNNFMDIETEIVLYMFYTDDFDIQLPDNNKKRDDEFISRVLVLKESEGNEIWEDEHNRTFQLIIEDFYETFGDTATEEELYHIKNIIGDSPLFNYVE